MAVLLGRTSAGAGTSDFTAAGDTAAWTFVASASGDLKYIWAQTQMANATLTGVELGIYADSAGSPGARLGFAAVDSLAAARGTATFRATLASTVPIVSGTTYWLAWFGGTENFDFKGDAVAGTYRESLGGRDFTDPFGTTTTGGTTVIIWGEDAPASSFLPVRIANRRVGPMALRRKFRQVFLSGPPATGQVQQITGTINGVATVSATVVRDRALTPVINGVAAVSAAVVRTRALSPVINGVATVSSSVVRIRALSPSLTGSATVTASVVRTRALVPSISAVATVSAGIVRIRALSPSVNGSATVTATVSTGSSTVPSDRQDIAVFIASWI